MKTIIVGGGKLGYNLFKMLRERKHDVTLIERNKEMCEKIAEDFWVDIFYGDGTDLDVLKEAGIEDAEIMVAVTGNDEDNLVICKIAKVISSNMKTIARVNNPKNSKMFELLGIDNTVCSTDVIANLIEYAMEREDYRIISTFEKGHMIMAEFVMKSSVIWCNRMVQELVLPDECVIVSLLRADKIIYPRGNTLIEADDKVILIANEVAMKHLLLELYSGGDKKWQLGKKKSKVF